MDVAIRGHLRSLDPNLSAYALPRYDGSFVGEAYNHKVLGGDWGKTKEEIDAISIANMKRVLNEVRAKYPHFEMKANSGLNVYCDEEQENYHS